MGGTDLRLIRTMRQGIGNAAILLAVAARADEELHGY
jgi:hypothetical protein